MNVVVASNELFDELKNIEEVVGAGVKKNNNKSYIVIYLSQATQAIINKIPTEYHGNKVKTEISGLFNLHTNNSH